MNNGSSFLEVTVKLGPGDVSQSVKSLQASIKENDGVLDLASGAKAKLLSVDILIPGIILGLNIKATFFQAVNCWVIL